MLTLLYRYSAALFVAAWPAAFWSLTAFGLLIAASAACYLIAEAVRYCEPEAVDDTLDTHYEAAKDLIRERNTQVEFARITAALDDVRGYWPNEIGGVE